MIGVPPSVALVGGAGHGATHLRRLSALCEDGRIRFAGVCDLRPVEAPPGVPVFAEHRALLADTSPDVVVICTPPHTHLPIALDALRAGADLLLEKPPVLNRAEHARLVAALAEAGRICQVGFQALGSAALHRLTGAIAAGRLGTVTGVTAAGAWWRDDGYFARVPWAGKRLLHGHPVLDGAVANPFAHALMNALVLTGGGRPATIAVERYRTRDIEVDDTACLRLSWPAGPELTMAVSLCSTEFIPGEITVTGTGGRAVLEYPTDQLELPGEAPTVTGRVDLLENLLAYRSEPEAVALLAPLAITESFTAVIEAIQAAPPPARIAAEWLEPQPGGPALPGIADLIRRAATGQALFSELDVPWAVPPWAAKLTEDEG